MKILIDTNVVLDMLLNRAPFSINAYQIFLMSYNRKIEGFISSTSATDIFYLANRTLKNKDTVYELFSDLQQILKFATVDETTIIQALQKRWKDFEDCVQKVCEIQNNCDYIITRNVKDFSNSQISVLLPEEFLQQFNS